MLSKTTGPALGHRNEAAQCATGFAGSSLVCPAAWTDVSAAQENRPRAEAARGRTGVSRPVAARGSPNQDTGQAGLASLPPIVSDNQPKMAPRTMDPIVGTIAFIGVMSFPSKIKPATDAKPYTHDGIVES